MLGTPQAAEGAFTPLQERRQNVDDGEANTGRKARRPPSGMNPVAQPEKPK